MADKPKVFVTRRIPAAGLDRIRAACDAEVWDGPLPPSYAVLTEKAAGCDGLVSLLTDRIDAALLDAAPRLRWSATTPSASTTSTFRPPRLAASWSATRPAC